MAFIRLADVTLQLSVVVQLDFDSGLGTRTQRGYLTSDLFDKFDPLLAMVNIIIDARISFFVMLFLPNIRRAVRFN